MIFKEVKIVKGYLKIVVKVFSFHVGEKSEVDRLGRSSYFSKWNRHTYINDDKYYVIM
jgi:hypothetical protein